MAANSAGPLSPLRALLDSFWICRVSIFSVLSGWLLLYGAPQAQSLFLDLQTSEIGFRHWIGFYLAVFLFWMLPTQLSTRVMLNAGADRFDVGRTASYEWLRVHLPWLLALACLVGIAAGQYWAFDHIPGKADRVGRPFEEAVYTQLSLLTVTTVTLIGLWLIAWILLPPVITRLTVRSGWLDVWLVRVIAMAMFGRRAATPGDGAAAAKADAGDDPRFTPEQLQSAWAAISLFCLWCVSLFFAILSPLETDPVFSRAPLLPVFLGAWLPVLTFFVYFAHRLRLPILAAFVLLMALLGNVLPRLHEMRPLTIGAPPEIRQPTLQEAIGIWRKANGCVEKTDSANPCPVRPIIVAAEGGASRAAFFTASLLAHLEDLSDPALPGNPPGAHLFSRQLFAISTVSGSSLGAAVFAALREDGWPRPGAERAENALWFKSGRAYGLNGVPKESLPGTITRKDVVQQILAGDFLSPAMAALSLDIWVPFHARIRNDGDRTYFLERAWEQRYADPSGSTRGSPGSTKSNFERGLSSLAPEENVWRPLLIFNGTSVTTGRRIITSTLYPLFKSPDDDRLDESVFRDSYDTYDLMCRRHAQTTVPPCVCLPPDDKQGLQARRIKGCDIRLSTAASNSARFPIVSSHGDIHGADGNVIDRVVDGAYFDYSGIISALELRLQIARLDDDLRPFVLFLTNDPGFNAHACALTKGMEAPKLLPNEELDVLRRPAEPPQRTDWGYLGTLLFPIDALVHAWVARTDQAMSQAVLLNRYENVKAGYQKAPQDFSELRRNYPDDLSFDVISVGARCNEDKQVRPIPMNWWLSMPTQSYLNEEICAAHNLDSLAGVLAQLGPRPIKPPKQDDVRTEQHKLYSLNRYNQERRRVEDRCPRGPGPRPRSVQTR